MGRRYGALYDQLSRDLKLRQGNAGDHREGHCPDLKTISQQLHTDFAISNDVHDSHDLDVPCLTGTIAGGFDLPYVTVTTFAVAQRGEHLRQQEQTIVSTGIWLHRDADQVLDVLYTSSLSSTLKNGHQHTRSRTTKSPSEVPTVLIEVSDL